MLTKELSDLVAKHALTVSERPIPTAAEILSAFSRLAEEVDRTAFARGIIVGQNHLSQIMTKVVLPMSAP